MASPGPARTALVTGASRGIGRAIALGLAEAGLDVALVATSTERLGEVAEEIVALGRRAVAIGIDVSDPAGVSAAAARAVSELGGIDLLVNAAGVFEAEVPLWEADPDQWWRTLEVNLRGPFLLSHALIPQMLGRGGGRVIDLSSGAACYEMQRSTAYTASKTALARMGASLHDEGHELGLRVFELAPGVVITDMTRDALLHVGRKEWTPVERSVELAVAIAQGDLDGCSGWIIRAGADSVADLQALAAASPPPTARRLRVVPAAPEDSLFGSPAAR
ncbi:MAG: SDR family oxidoreductase [Promicromonosporaceae bacterium]|nr:SDR family oxidoreductase [Promicromonosporaceae bacterium]